MNKKTVKDIDLKGKKVVMRVDFNVPLKEGKITDDTRVKAALPTIKYILEQGAALVLMSHLGRPSGKGYEADFSLKPVADYLQSLLGVTVKFAQDCMNADAEAAALKAGEILMLDNTRFYKAEEGKAKTEGLSDEEAKAKKAEMKAKKAEMAEKLSTYGDVYVNDAFGTAHRDHASTASICKFMKKKGAPCVAGFLMQKELDYLGTAVETPARPFVAIIGGAKVSGKLEVLQNLMKKVDAILIGGGMAYTFLKAQGHDIAKSLCEDELIDTAKATLAAAKEAGVKFLLPIDNVAADKFDAEAATQIVGNDIPADWMALDIGPKTVELYANEIKNAKTIVWNGPMGCFEMEKFAAGTMGVCKAVADSGAVSIIGGGDSVSAVNKSGLASKMTHISTGGGASLEFLEGKDLPGCSALDDKIIRRKLIAGNWKMNMTASAGAQLINDIKAQFSECGCKGCANGPEVLVCPPFTTIGAVVEAAKGTCLNVGAQNIHWEEKGAFTGEISADMLLEAGVNYVIVGHSERRQYFGETDETVNKRALAALAHGLKVIICVGETLQQREDGKTSEVIENQVRKALANIAPEQMANVVIAYEPVWAIGTGKTATDEQAQEVHAGIRALLKSLFECPCIAESTRILYGGSMNDKNAAGLLAQKDIDGGLIGGAALKPAAFATIIKAALA